MIDRESTFGADVLPGIKTDTTSRSSPRPRPSRACTFATRRTRSPMTLCQGVRSDRRRAFPSSPRPALPKTNRSRAATSCAAVRPDRCDMGFNGGLRRRASSSRHGRQPGERKKLRRRAFDSYHCDRTSLSWLKAKPERRKPTTK